MITKTAMVALIGRPNVGKSTLTNALVGEKIAIVTNKPQTTRNRIFGIINSGDTQIILMDTPGFHKARTRLGDYMVNVVNQSVSDVDAAVLVVEPIPNIGTQEGLLIEKIKESRVPAILVINKIDTVEKDVLLSVIAEYSGACDFDAIVPLSAETGDGTDILLEEIKKYGVRGRILQFDTTNREQCQKVISKDIEKNGIYYGVVLNAGITSDSVFPSMTDEDWDNVLNTNLGGFYNVLKPIVMPMIASRIKGRIVAMSSVSGIRGNYGQVNYSASKAGIIGAAKALALELAKRKITVNCVAPGAIESDMTHDLPVEEIKKHIPMKRFGTAKEVASLVNYLMSEDAGYITGQVISVNGGLY